LKSYTKMQIFIPTRFGFSAYSSLDKAIDHLLAGNHRSPHLRRFVFTKPDGMDLQFLSVWLKEDRDFDGKQQPDLYLGRIQVYELDKKGPISVGERGVW
jgi:hypothetical protein